MNRSAFLKWIAFSLLALYLLLAFILLIDPNFFGLTRGDAIRFSQSDIFWKKPILSNLQTLQTYFLERSAKVEPEFDPSTLSGEELYKYYIFEIAEDYENVEPELVISLVERESNFQPTATNANGTCVGLMQISTKYHMPRARELGVSNLRDPYRNLLTGIDLLSDLIDMAGGDIPYALMLYNMKTADANALHAQGRTTNYVRTILARQEEIKKEVRSYA